LRRANLKEGIQREKKYVDIRPKSKPDVRKHLYATRLKKMNKVGKNGTISNS
jgi:uncharacterized membrane protein